MNLGDLMYLESKTVLKESLIKSLAGVDSPMKPRALIELPEISNSLKVPPNLDNTKFETVQRNLTNFIVYHNQKHKRNISDSKLEKEHHDEAKYHKIPKIMKKDPSRNALMMSPS